ncbi:MAG TPA: response regulator transcription factor [Polyangia bacterium]|nr:response regulator transcription factor [Polyangia bacterium]
MLTAVIVQDHAMVRDAFARLLASTARFQVIGCAGTIREALLLVQGLAPDVIVADLPLEKGKAVGFLRALKRQGNRAPTLILTEFEDGLFASEVEGAGAAGCVSKERPTREILRAIDEALAGRKFAPAAGKRTAGSRATVTRRAGT